MKRYGSTLIVVVISLLALGACNTIPPGDVLPPTPGSSAVLEQVVLQPDELPAEFENYAVQDVGEAFPTTPAALEGLADAAVVLANTSDRSKVYSNGILRYENERLAEQALTALRESTRGTEEPFEIEPLGDEYYPFMETIANSGMPQDIYLAMILWRDGATLAYISSAQLSEPPDIQLLESLAHTINDRLP